MVDENAPLTRDQAQSARLHEGLFSWGPFRSRGFLLTENGRMAVRLALRSLRIGDGDEVLVPSYCCGTELAAIQAEGVHVRLFPIGASLRIDLDLVAGMVGERTRALYAIHYFGVPQDMPELKNFAQGRGLAVIEDCALSLFSDDAAGNSTGTLGDAAIFSFRKSLPWCRGGAFVGRTEGLAAPVPRSGLSRLADRIGSAARGLQRRVGLGAGHGSASGGPAALSPPDMPRAYYVRPQDPITGMDSEMVDRCRTVKPEHERSGRRTRWNRWLQVLSVEHGATPALSALPSGACPLFFPLLVEDRPAWLKALGEKGFELPPWWMGAPRGFDWSAFPDAIRLKQCVLPLPVGLEMSKERFARLEAETLMLGRAAPGWPGNAPAPTRPA